MHNNATCDWTIKKIFPNRFLYSDEVQIGPETVMTTLYTAKKYAVPALEAHCVEFLKKNLRADNAFMLLTQVRLEEKTSQNYLLKQQVYMRMFFYYISFVEYCYISLGQAL